MGPVDHRRGGSAKGPRWRLYKAANPACKGLARLDRAVLRPGARGDEPQLAGLFNDAAMPHAARHDEGLPGLQNGSALAARGVEHQLQLTRQQGQDLLAGGMALPMVPVGVLARTAHQAAVAEVVAAFDARPELGAAFHGKRALVGPEMDIGAIERQRPRCAGLWPSGRS